jgi:hypothetical protein
MRHRRLPGFVNRHLEGIGWCVLALAAFYLGSQWISRPEQDIVLETRLGITPEWSFELGPSYGQQGLHFIGSNTHLRNRGASQPLVWIVHLPVETLESLGLANAKAMPEPVIVGVDEIIFSAEKDFDVFISTGVAKKSRVSRLHPDDEKADVHGFGFSTSGAKMLANVYLYGGEPVQPKITVVRGSSRTSFQVPPGTERTLGETHIVLQGTRNKTYKQGSVSIFAEDAGLHAIRLWFFVGVEEFLSGSFGRIGLPGKDVLTYRPGQAVRIEYAPLLGDDGALSRHDLYLFDALSEQPQFPGRARSITIGGKERLPREWNPSISDLPVAIVGAIMPALLVVRWRRLTAI